MNDADTLRAVALHADTIPTPAARRLADSARLLARRTHTARTMLDAIHEALAWPATTPGNGLPGTRNSNPTSRTERAAIALIDTPAGDHATLDENITTALAAAKTAVTHYRTALRQHAEQRPVPDIIDTLDLVDDWTFGATRALKICHDACTRHMPDRDPRATWRCKGTGDENGAGCENVADYRIIDGRYELNPDHPDGRCVDCRNVVAAREEAERRAREAARQRRFRHRRAG